MIDLFIYGEVSQMHLKSTVIPQVGTYIRLDNRNFIVLDVTYVWTDSRELKHVDIGVKGEK